MDVLRHFDQFKEKHCPLLKVANRLHFPYSRRNLSQILLFVVLIGFIWNFYTIADWVESLTIDNIYGLTQGESQDTDQQQPSDGGVGGHNGKSGGNGNENPDGGGGSQDMPQAPSSSGSGSSSSGDNGDDDPNKKPPTHKTQEPTEVESKEETNDDNSQSQSKRKGHMVTNKLQPLASTQQIGTSRDQGSSVIPEQLCSNSWMPPSYKNFEYSGQSRMCPLEERLAIHESTNDEQQLPPSAASIGEEQLNLEYSSVTSSAGILDQLPFYTTIEIESFSGPQSELQLGQDVTAESIQALYANTYYDLAHLEVVQEQVLQAAEATDAFEYTLAIVMYDSGTQLLVPCLPDAEFNPDEDIHIVAIPANSVLSAFTVHINQHLHHFQ